MDILGAINKEREYLSFRMKGEEPYSFLEEVKKYGFSNISEFIKAKKDYQFSLIKFKIVNTTPDKAIKEIFSTIENKITAVLFADTDKTLVWNGDNGNYNAEYCSQCEIPIYPLYTGGGTIVSTSGDLNIGICFPENSEYNSNYILNKIAEIFKSYTDKSVVISKNDILVDGFNVLGSSSYYNNGMFVFITPVSMSDKTQLICEICQEHSTKQPGYIDFMTSKQLREEIKRWLKIV